MNAKGLWNGFDSGQIAVLRRLNTPAKVQDFLDFELPYNYEKQGETLYSPRLVLRENKAHCFEGALFAACTLRFHGFKPLIVDLVASEDDDHILALFKEKGLWGCVAKSKFTGLRYREPIHRNLRELVLSSFEGYYNFDGKKSLRSYSEPFDLSKFDSAGWMASGKPLWPVEKALNRSKHHGLFPKGLERKFRLVDGSLFKAEVLGRVGTPLYKQKPFNARKLLGKRKSHV